MVVTILLVLFYLLFPVVILYSAYKVKILAKIGTIILAYAVGLILGNTNLISESYTAIPRIIATVTIPLAIPLLLFSMDIRKFKIIAGTTLKSTIFALIGVIGAVVSGYYLFGKHIPEGWKLAGMLVGVYTGGTPNLAALKTALDVNNNTYILTHTADTFITIFLILFFLTIAQKILLLFLPAFPKIDEDDEKMSDLKNAHNEQLQLYDDSPDAFAQVAKNYKKTYVDILIALGLTLLIVAISFGIGQLVPQHYFEPVVILSITTLAIIASLFPKVRNLKNTFQVGMYLILIFSLAVASLGKFSKLLNGSVDIFYYVAWAIFMSFFIHVALSAIFRVDADSTITITTAFSMSPPFVPVVASALKNKYVIVSGLLVGILGYAIGNYLGVLVAYSLK